MTNCEDWYSLVDFDGSIVHQIEDDELVVADLHDCGNGFVGVFGWLRFRVVHFEKGSGDAIRAKGGALIYVYQNDIDIDQGTILNATETQRYAHNSDRGWSNFRPTPFQIVKDEAISFRPREQLRLFRNFRPVRPTCNSARKRRKYWMTREPT